MTVHEERSAAQYVPMRCRLLGQTVSVVVRRRADGAGEIVNCLDKDQHCFGTGCAFTTDQGEWPFGEVRTVRLPS